MRVRRHRRIGSGELAYPLTPVRFYVGCLSVATVFDIKSPAILSQVSPVLRNSLWGAPLFLPFALWRLSRPLLAARSGRALMRKGLAAYVWSPHVATTVIGVTFLLMFMLVGSWAYTDVLAEAARGMAASLPARWALLLALLAGAVLGGITARAAKAFCVSPRQFLRCFSGGMLMGWGSLLIPGGNNGLVLVGMPLLWPYAWLAFTTMCTTIAFAMARSRMPGH